MKIVIDIPEEDYKNGTLINCFKVYSTELDKIIYDGIPLPKHHGRLIYAKDVGKYLTLADVPTIIEADGGGEDDLKT